MDYTLKTIVIEVPDECDINAYDFVMLEGPLPISLNSRWNWMLKIRKGEDAPKPTFEIGKRYRTREGRIEGPIEPNSQDNKVAYPLSAPSVLTWTSDGAYFIGTPQPVDGHPRDLMPGAIEDEPAAQQAECAMAVSNNTDQSRMELLASHQQQIDELKSEIKRLEGRIGAIDAEQSDQLNRINHHRDRFSDHGRQIKDLGDRLDRQVVTDSE